ncbi:MAG: hypothetical protein OXI81_14415 [Paracoccaceae bacterium]|nr:hypothetical protein [Paracoccaceae bacterium]MDE2911493.1 hypothetical protein [Paracoccaceae bacterium]
MRKNTEPVASNIDLFTLPSKTGDITPTVSGKEIDASISTKQGWYVQVPQAAILESVLSAKV